MRVGFHAGQLLQPVPGGIGRYQRALLAHLPDAGVDVVAFAAGARPKGVDPRVPWIDLGPPQVGLGSLPPLAPRLAAVLARLRRVAQEERGTPILVP